MMLTVLEVAGFPGNKFGIVGRRFPAPRERVRDGAKRGQSFMNSRYVVVGCDPAAPSFSRSRESTSASVSACGRAGGADEGICGGGAGVTSGAPTLKSQCREADEFYFSRYRNVS